MRIQVDIVGLPMVSDALGARRLELEIPGKSLDELLETIADRGGHPARKILFTEDGRPDASIQVVVNGERFVSPGEGVELSDGDRITVMMLVGGG